MTFLTNLFGGTENTVWTALLALAVVLVLIIFGVWALKMLFSATRSVGRGRNKRLALVDQLPIDQRRQLLLIRRDNVEHLLLIGTGQDIVVETGIEAPPQAAMPRQVRHKPQAGEAQEPQIASPRRVPEPEMARQAPEMGVPPKAAEPASSNPLDRLRELGRPAAERRPQSLRHTGLLRPLGRTEPLIAAQGPQESADETTPEGADSVNKAADRAELAVTAAMSGGPKATDGGGKREGEVPTTGRAGKAG